MEKIHNLKVGDLVKLRISCLSDMKSYGIIIKNLDPYIKKSYYQIFSLEEGKGETFYRESDELEGI